MDCNTYTGSHTLYDLKLINRCINIKKKFFLKFFITVIFHIKFEENFNVKIIITSCWVIKRNAAIKLINLTRKSSYLKHTVHRIQSYWHVWMIRSWIYNCYEAAVSLIKTETNNNTVLSLVTRMWLIEVNLNINPRMKKTTFIIAFSLVMQAIAVKQIRKNEVLKFLG